VDSSLAVNTAGRCGTTMTSDCGLIRHDMAGVQSRFGHNVEQFLGTFCYHAPCRIGGPWPAIILCCSLRCSCSRLRRSLSCCGRTSNRMPALPVLRYVSGRADQSGRSIDLPLCARITATACLAA
jgi:hypothetical protein